MCSLLTLLLKSVYIFGTKICYSIKNHSHHGKKLLNQEVEDGYISVKHSDDFASTVTKHIYMTEKHHTLVFTNCGHYFCILEFCIQSL